MHLRYRLFLWVGGIYMVAFLVSFFLENYITRTSLEKNNRELLAQIDETKEVQKHSLNKYLIESLHELAASVDVLLNGVSHYPGIIEGLVATEKNLRNGTWLSLSSLLLTNKWIDFIQNSNEQNLMSEILIEKSNLNSSFHFPINENIHLVAVRSEANPNKWMGPYIGIKFTILSFYGDKQHGPVEEPNQHYYALFTPETILSFNQPEKQYHLDLSINFLEPLLRWVAIPSDTFFLRNFVSTIQEAKTYAKDMPKKDQWTRNILEKMNDLSRNKMSTGECYSLFQKAKVDTQDLEALAFEKGVELYLKSFVSHNSQIGLIWGLTVLNNTGMFGSTPLSSTSPIGMGVVDPVSHCGKTLLSRSAFSHVEEYDFSALLERKEMPPNQILLSNLSVINPKYSKHVFFGNVIKLQTTEEGQAKEGYLTVGRNAQYFTNDLATTVNQNALFITGNEIVTVFDKEGEEITNSVWNRITPRELLSKESGTITVGKTEYFFLHLQPSKELDIHFFIFNPTEQEFAFINAINTRSQELINKIGLEMRLSSIGGMLFVLIFLNNISKRISKPIAYLAEVSNTVNEGSLNDVQIPEDGNVKGHDEIEMLYHSFFEMIKGLKEKERVRAVLNKVVSREIAEATLSGSIQLGGEEKRVTMFFADLRSFTKMTGSMSPKEVIHLINTCMTKISAIIDQFGGVIDKYIGDAVMALYGAPIEKKEAAAQAIKSGLEIINALEEWNKERVASGLERIEMGVGIHTGTVIAGNMGAEDRLNYTVLGTNVNLASRICSKALGMQVLISEDTLNEPNIRDLFVVEKLEPVELKGFAQPTSVYAVKGFKKI